jgi:hypothetical protein
VVGEQQLSLQPQVQKRENRRVVDKERRVYELDEVLLLNEDRNMKRLNNSPDCNLSK